MNSRDELGAPFLAQPGSPPVEWAISRGLTPYDDAVAEMERRVAAISEGTAAERIWLVEHPPLYTAGTSARAAIHTAPAPAQIMASR